MSIHLKLQETTPDVFFKENKLLPLNSEEVNERKKIFGKNIIQKHSSRSWQAVLLNSILDPFNVLLIGISFLSITLDDYKTFFIMIIMVFISGGIRFVQELQSETKLNDLTSMVKNNVIVVRRNNFCEYEESINLDDCVPGDFIKLAAGDKVLADIQLIKSNNLYVDQSILTGESMTSLKNVSCSDKIIIEYDFLSEKKNSVKTLKTKVKNFICDSIKEYFFFYNEEIKSKIDSTVLTKFDSPDICFMGTSIISGTGLGIILNTGKQTYFGIMSERISFRKPKTSFDKGIKLISFLFIFLMIIISIPILLLKGFDLLKQQEKSNNYHRWVNAAQFALSVAIGLTPEMLPMILNANLAKGTIFLSNKNCIVKRLQSIINLGSMNVLCTDKTGTLTENYAQLNKVYDYLKNDCSIGLELAYLNSAYQSGFKNLTDQAIIIGFNNKLKLMNKQNKTDKINLQIDSQKNINDILVNKIKEIPFDFNRRKTSVFFEIPSLNLRLLVTKGAVKEMLDICSFFLEQQNFNNEPTIFNMKTLLEILKNNSSSLNKNKKNLELHSTPKPMTLDIKINLKKFNDQLNEEGYRVLAVAYKLEKINEEKSFMNCDSNEKDLIFVSFLSFFNPPKESASNAITSLMKNGIQIKVLSGDTVEVCRNVCKQLGLPTENIVNSKELFQTTKLDFKDISSKTVFSQLTPIQKLKIVKSLKSHNFVVGFLGDGINDALALKDSDIGISVDSGTEIAKDAADIVLLEKQLDVINDGVYFGRKAYVNTVKYISMAVSGNFGNVLSILISCLWLNFLPMAPIHILLQNLLYDISQMTMPWDNVDEENLKKPQVLDAKNIVYFMLFLGPVSTFFDIVTFAFIYFYYGIQNENDDITTFQTGWFTVGVLTQTLVCHIERTQKIPFLQSNASIQVYISTLFTLIVGLLIPLTPLAEIFCMKKLPVSFYYFLIIISISYCVSVQIMKKIFIHLFKFWFTEI